jgi:hypothetical protein
MELYKHTKKSTKKPDKKPISFEFLWKFSNNFYDNFHVNFNKQLSVKKQLFPYLKFSCVPSSLFWNVHWMELFEPIWLSHKSIMYLFLSSKFSFQIEMGKSLFLLVKKDFVGKLLHHDFKLNFSFLWICWEWWHVSLVIDVIWLGFLIFRTGNPRLNRSHNRHEIV